MGLFSKTVTTVATNVTRILQDDAISSSVLQGYASSQAPDADPELVPNVLEHMATGIGVKANLMYAYAKRAYTNGLPEGTLQNASKGKELLEDYYTTVIGQPIVTDYYHYGSLNLTHYGWDILFNYLDYSPNTNVIGSLSTSGKQCFLKSIQAVITTTSQAILTPAALDQWGPPPQAGVTPEFPYQTPEIGKQLAMPVYLVDPEATVDKIRITYVWKKITGEIVEEYTDHAVEGWNASETDWHHFRGHPVDNPTATFIITYEDGTGELPFWDSTFNVPLTGTGSYFPWAYLRFNKTRPDKDTGGVEYKTTKRLLKYLNMEYEDLIDGIHQSPDIKDVEQSIVMMAVPAQTNNEKEQRYLFDFFTSQYIQSGADDDKLTPDAYTVASRLGMVEPEQSITIQDKKFQMALTYRNIIKRKVVGSIGRVGSYSHRYSFEKFDKDGHLIGTIENAQVSYNFPCHSYMHQVSETLYWEVLVFNLKMKYHVFNEYWTTGDEKDDILLIPIDHLLVQHYSIPDREILLARSLHIVFNSRILTKLKWYQTPAFSFIMTIIAIVLTIISLGGFSAVWGAVAAAIAGSTAALTALAYALLIQFLKTLLISYALKLFVKVAGIRVGFVAAIVTLVAAIATQNPTLIDGSVKGAPWAVTLLNVSTGLVQGVQKETLEDFKNLLDEQREFKTYADKETERLKKANEQFRNPSNILAPLIVIGETPTDFYSRTIHAGNVGMVAIESISSYVDITLRLPTFTDTMGETFNG